MMRSYLAPLCVLWLGCHAGRGEEADMTPPDGGGGGADLRGADLALVAPFAFLDIDTLYQNCKAMPPAADPLLLKGRLTVRNEGGLQLGPITISGGALFDKSESQVATFQLSEKTLPAIGPNGSIDGKVVDKLANSLTPQTGCQAVPCGEPVRVELQLAGANLPPGSKAKSASYVVVCN